MDGYADQTFKNSSFPTESLSPPGESVSRFRNGLIRIKMTYFNIEYAKVFVAFIGKSLWYIRCENVQTLRGKQLYVVQFRLTKTFYNLLYHL